MNVVALSGWRKNMFKYKITNVDLIKLSPLNSALKYNVNDIKIIKIGLWKLFLN